MERTEERRPVSAESQERNKPSVVMPGSAAGEGDGDDD
jgi:hypothetical protein